MSTKSKPSADSEIFETIHSITHLYRSQQFRSLREGPHELGPMEFRALRFIARHSACTQSDLVAHSGRDKGQVARLLRGLRDAGLVDADADPVDRRITRLSLSRQGQALFDEVHVQGEHLSELALAGLSAQERSSLQSLLQHVRENLARKSDAD
jgi:DNA-binding MarR family transcriptional regulator